MFRIDTPNKAVDLFGAGKHGFRDGDMALGVNPTELSAAQQNALQEEILGVIEAAGVVPNKANNAQLVESIQRLIDAQSGNYALDTGAANAYVIALNPAIAAYEDGLTVRFKIVNGNTGASTLNAGAGVVALVNDAGGALVQGDAPAGNIVTATYISAAGKFYITSAVQSQGDARYAKLTDVPAGHLIMWTGATAPTGFLQCPTSATNISRTTYAALFAAIGTTWGAGDGATTFGMPWFAAGYTGVHNTTGIGTTTHGALLAHIHGTPTGFSGSGSAGPGAGSSGFGTSTDIAGGADNKAAGNYVMFCVKY